MRTVTSRFLQVLAPALVVAAAVSGCAAVTPTALSAPAAAPATTTEPAAEKPAATKPRVKPVAGTKVATCRTADLTTTVIGQPDRTRGTVRMAMMRLTNASQRTCRLEGWASVTLVNPANEAVPVPTRNVNEPGAPVRTDLQPGAAAWAGIKWNACDKSDDTCGVGNSLRFNLEASTDGASAELESFPAAERVGITMKSLQIGSLQPIRQGVVAW
jgi:hypothetical protein